MTDAPADPELAIRKAWEALDYAHATTLAMEAYGVEIMSFLVARLRSASDAEEVFAMFAEDAWKGLPQFSFRCSARGWLYTVARNAANRYSRSPARRAARNIALEGNPSVDAVIDKARSTTEGYRRTAMKDRVRALRDHLSAEDQAILLLHVDRNLPWREIAMVLHEQGADLDDGALDRESARLRKRFERVKAELRELAIEAGLIERKPHG